MPGVRDKIIINGIETRGMSKAINAQYGAATFLADEIEELGCGREVVALGFRDEVAALCFAYDKAQQDHLNGLRDVTDRMRKWIDEVLAAKSQP